jgi:hypothetical protein
MVIEILMVARILGSAVREDRIARRILPKGLLFHPLMIDMLIKFGLFVDPQTQGNWLLPMDLAPSTPIPPDTRVRGTYRQNKKLAIDELGGREQIKKWIMMVNTWISDRGKRDIVWRDGMSQYILMVLRSEAWKRLDALRREYLFHVTVDETLRLAVVGENVGEREKVKEQDVKEEKGDVEGDAIEETEQNTAVTTTFVNEPMQTPELTKSGSESALEMSTNNSVRTQDLQTGIVAENAGEREKLEGHNVKKEKERDVVNESAARTHILNESQTSPRPTNWEGDPALECDRTHTVVDQQEHKIRTRAAFSSKARMQKDKTLWNSQQPHISAILYLGPPEVDNSWEYKLIAIQNQSAPAILFNLRRIFPERADYYISRLVKPSNAVAVQSSHMASITLYQMLRLSMYLDGDEKANEIPDMSGAADKQKDGRGRASRRETAAEVQDEGELREELKF